MHTILTFVLTIISNAKPSPRLTFFLYLLYLTSHTHTIRTACPQPSPNAPTMGSIDKNYSGKTKFITMKLLSYCIIYTIYRSMLRSYLKFTIYKKFNCILMYVVSDDCDDDSRVTNK